MRETAETGQKILYYSGSPALSYPDVFIYPAESDISSRHGSDISTQTKLTSKLSLNIPLISAGMDTVTESKMAITMALRGGMGEIHRNNTPDQEATEVRKVKERMRVIEEYPPMVGEKATIGEAKALLEKRQRGYVIVYEGSEFNGFIAGMATMKDFEAGKLDMPIQNIMTPLIPKKDRERSLITAPEGTGLEDAVEIMRRHRIEKLPVLNNEGKLIGVYTIKDSQYILGHPDAAVDAKGRLLVGAAIGVHESDILRAQKLVEAGVDVLFLDIAHGHSRYSQIMLERLKERENIKVPIIAGNVATKEGVLFLYNNGADGIKVGIGPGGVCTTRNIAGTGVPQITALLEAREALANRRHAPPIIADGGIREPGDAAKALTIADSVMIGSLFAGTDESPGEPVNIDGTGLKKRVRGMASAQVAKARVEMGDSTTDITKYVPEGRERHVVYQGPVGPIINRFVGGIRSGMSYAGAHDMGEMKKAKLIYVSQQGAEENKRGMT